MRRWRHHWCFSSLHVFFEWNLNFNFFEFWGLRSWRDLGKLFLILLLIGNFWMFFSLNFQNMINFVIWKVLKPNLLSIFFSRQRSLVTYWLVRLLYILFLLLLNINVFFVYFLFNEQLMSFSNIFIVLFDFALQTFKLFFLFISLFLFIFEEFNCLLIESRLRIPFLSQSRFCLICRLDDFLKKLLTIKSLWRRYNSWLNNIAVLVHLLLNLL